MKTTLETSVVQVVMKGKESVDPNAKIVIVSYTLILKEQFHKTASGQSWKVVVCDESHAIKDPKTQRSKAVVPILQKARRVKLHSKRVKKCFTKVHSKRVKSVSRKYTRND